MEESKIVKYASACVITATASFALWLVIKYALGALFPFIFAMLIASIIRPVANALYKKSKVPAKLCGAIIVIVAAVFSIYGLIAAGDKLIDETTAAIGRLTTDLEDENNIIKQTIDFFTNLRDRIPLLSKLDATGSSGASEEIYDAVVSILKKSAADLSKQITSFAGGFIKALPRFIFSVVVGVIALFYLIMDYDGVKDGVSKLLPKSVSSKLSRYKSGAMCAVSSYLRAYLVILLLTFSELFFGFIILGFKYSFLLAVIVAVIDILPVFGVGTALIPWSAVLFIKGDFSHGIGLLALFAIIYVIRQFAEPRLIGKFMGIHPLIALIAAYLGFSFFGIIGMIIAPIALYIFKIAISVDE